MTVALLISREENVPCLLHWAAHFARGLKSDLLVLQPQAPSGEPRTVDVSFDDDGDDRLVAALRATADELSDVVLASTAEADETSEGDAPPRATVTLKRVQHSTPVVPILKELRAAKVRLLIIPRLGPLPDGGGDEALEKQLFRRAPSETIQLRPGIHTGERCERILAPVAGGPHSVVALRLARDVVDAGDGEVTALFVEPRVGVDAESVGKRILEKILARALGKAHPRVHSRVVLGNDIRKGIGSVDLESYDLVLLGASNNGVVRRTLFGTIPDHLMRQETAPAVAAVRARVPLTNRMRRTTERLLQRVVPQLARDDRLSLVERVQSNSEWDFDFVTLMALSTSIAAFGLVRDAAAVVIGAMLVAPLMTPLLGTGLALVQGNALLIRKATRSVVSGFFLAFVLGYGIGHISFLEEPTLEMLARGSPNLLDLAVAFVSGIAAAYATCRPNLSAALPGVAIAAALVPPIATAGLAVALGRNSLAMGAALLFFTNIVAIVIATSLTLWAVGIRNIHEHSAGARWTRWVHGGLLVLVATLLVVLVLPGGLPTDAVDALKKEIEIQPGAIYVRSHLTRRFSHVQLNVQVQSPEPVPGALASRLAEVVAPHFDVPVQVSVRTQLLTISQPTGNPKRP